MNPERVTQNPAPELHQDFIFKTFKTFLIQHYPRTKDSYLCGHGGKQLRYPF